MSDCKVSLIIPCYNVESINAIEYIDTNPFEDMINSILNQSFGIENIEVLLVDDCSTDNTKNVLLNLSNKYPTFKPIFLKKNSGRPSIPRNIGINNATTDFIMFLDQDDIMDSVCVEKLYNEIISTDVDFVKSNYSIRMGNDFLKYDTGKNEHLIIKPKSESMVYVVSHFVWGSIYKKKFLDKYDIRFPDTQAEDNLFLSKCFNFTNKNIISLNDYYSLIYTANNQNSLAHTFTLKQIKDYILIYEETIDSYIEYGQNDKFISLNLQRYILILIGSILRSKESFKVKKEMMDKVKKFLLKYNNIKITLPSYWKLFYILILYNFKITIYLSSLIVNFLFETPIFKKLFRNKDYL